MLTHAPTLSTNIEEKTELKKRLGHNYGMLLQKTKWLLLLRSFNTLLKNFQPNQHALQRLLILVELYNLKLGKFSLFNQEYTEPRLEASAIRQFHNYFPEGSTIDITIIDNKLRNIRKDISTSIARINNSTSLFIKPLAKVISSFQHSMYYQLSSSFICFYDEAIKKFPQYSCYIQSEAFKTLTIIGTSLSLLIIDIYIARYFLLSQYLIQPLVDFVIPDIDDAVRVARKHHIDEHKTLSIYSLVKSIITFILYMFVSFIQERPSLLNFTIMAFGYLFATQFVQLLQNLFSRSIPQQTASSFKQSKGFGMIIVGYMGFMIANKLFRYSLNTFFGFLFPPPQRELTCPIEADILAGENECNEYPNVCEQLVRERLGISAGVLTIPNIDTLFRNQARQLHPDKSHDEITSAYTELVDARDRGRELVGRRS